MEKTETIPPATFHGDDGAFRPKWPAIAKGFARRCPRCGKGHLFQGYSRVQPACGHCGQPFTGHRADDAPPYITMMIVGHALAIPIVEVKRHLDPSLGVALLLWVILAMVMTYWLLPRTKGGLIGLQWANRMHGFGQHGDDDPESPLRV